jgi:Spy/CpxP family protein refolding chaperone
MVLVVMLVAALTVLVGGGHAVSAQDPMDNLVKELGLSPFQVMNIRMLLEGFARKEQGATAPQDILLRNRAVVRDVITGTPFDRQKAEGLAQQVASVLAQRIVDRLEVRNQIFQVLTPEQQKLYITMAQEALDDAQSGY